MNVAVILRGVLRRWYIVAVGLLLAVGGSIAMWGTVPPANERSASLLLMPGQGTLPETTSNPYLYLGNLATSVDVLARASAREDFLNEVLVDVPGTKVSIARDFSTSAPVLALTVLSATDADAERALDLVIAHVETTLDDLQSGQDIVDSQRIRLQELNVDSTSTVQQKTRMAITAATGLGILLFSVLIAALTDGLVRRAQVKGRRRRRQPERKRATRPDVEDREATEPAVPEDEFLALRSAADELVRSGDRDLSAGR